jgi:iron-sulfur cluster repair protein YtfE (RIC family)
VTLDDEARNAVPTGVGKDDPVRQLEHTHGHLNKLVLAVAESLEGSAPDSASAWKKLHANLSALRDELLQHFADEEEGLFPFVRASVPARADVVDRLEAAHDTICGSIVRMVHLAGGAHHPSEAIRTLHERFEHAYTKHSSDEAALFEELGRVLNATEREELAKRLRGL